MIKAYWFDQSENKSGYVWKCPHCESLNDVKEESFTWNQEVQKQVADGSQECGYCESDEKHLVCKD